MFIRVKVIPSCDYTWEYDDPKPKWQNADSKPQVITINTDHIVAIYEGLLVMSIRFGIWREWEHDLRWRNTQPFIPLWDGEWIRLTKLLEANK